MKEAKHRSVCDCYLNFSLENSFTYLLQNFTFHWKTVLLTVYRILHFIGKQFYLPFTEFYISWKTVLLTVYKILHFIGKEFYL